VKILLAISSNAIACSWETVGKSSKNSSSATPASKWSNKLSTETRVPKKNRLPA